MLPQLDGSVLTESSQLRFVKLENQINCKQRKLGYGRAASFTEKIYVLAQAEQLAQLAAKMQSERQLVACRNELTKNKIAIPEGAEAVVPFEVEEAAPKPAAAKGAGTMGLLFKKAMAIVVFFLVIRKILFWMFFVPPQDGGTPPSAAQVCAELGFLSVLLCVFT